MGGVNFQLHFYPLGSHFCTSFNMLITLTSTTRHNALGHIPALLIKGVSSMIPGTTCHFWSESQARYAMGHLFGHGNYPYPWNR